MSEKVIAFYRKNQKILNPPSLVAPPPERNRNTGRKNLGNPRLCKESCLLCFLEVYEVAGLCADFNLSFVSLSNTASCLHGES